MSGLIGVSSQNVSTKIKADIIREVCIPRVFLTSYAIPRESHWMLPNDDNNGSHTVVGKEEKKISHPVNSSFQQRAEYPDRESNPPYKANGQVLRTTLTSMSPLAILTEHRICVSWLHPCPT